MKMQLHAVLLQIFLLFPIALFASWCNTDYHLPQHFDQKKQNTTLGELFTNPVIDKSQIDYYYTPATLTFNGFYAANPSVTTNGASIKKGLRAHSKPNVAAASLVQSPSGINITSPFVEGAWGFLGFWFGCLTYATTVGTGVPTNCTLNVTSDYQGFAGSGPISELYNYSIPSGKKIANMVPVGLPFDGTPPYGGFFNLYIVPDPPDVVVLFDDIDIKYHDFWPTSTGTCNCNRCGQTCGPCPSAY